MYADMHIMDCSPAVLGTLNAGEQLYGPDHKPEQSHSDFMSPINGGDICEKDIPLDVRIQLRERGIKPTTAGELQVYKTDCLDGRLIDHGEDPHTGHLLRPEEREKSFVAAEMKRRELKAVHTELSPDHFVLSA